MSDQSGASARKIERSCANCHRRKVRCDKRSPCNQCVRGGHNCFYPPPTQGTRRTRKTTMNDVANRVAQLEKTLSAVSNNHQGPSSAAAPVSGLSPAKTSPADAQSMGTTECDGERRNSNNEVLLKKGSSSQYFNEVLLSRVIEREHDVRTALATPRSESPQPFPSPFNPMGLLSYQNLSLPIHSYHPPKWTAMQLWKVYDDCVDPCTKILHIPTTEVVVFTVVDDPTKASAEALALCYAIYYAATVALDVEGMKSRDEWLANLHQYKMGLEQAISSSNFLENPTLMQLQAAGIYLSAVRVHNSGRGVWIINGLCIRTAQCMGLHRDGKKLGLSPFDAEVRRRLWWHFLARDGRAAEDYGLTTSCHNIMVDVDLPLNIDDNDIYPEMTQLPCARPGWTRMTLSLVNIEIVEAWARLSQFVSTSNDSPKEEFRAQIVGDLIRRMEERLQHCNPVVPSHRMTLDCARFILRKVDVITRQHWLTLSATNTTEILATEENLAEAVNILEQADLKWNEELVRPYRWSMLAYPQLHFMLYILWHLCVRPRGPTAEKAFAAVENHVEQNRLAERGPIQGSKWTVLMALQAKAAALMKQSDTGLGSEAQGLVQRPVSMGNVPILPSTSDFLAGVEGRGDALLPVPDWGTLLNDFQLDTDYSIIF